MVDAKKGANALELEDVELAGGHTFRISSVHDVFRKLNREKKRFLKAENDRGDQIDAAINFAMTAWHLSDWIWKAHEDRLRDGLKVNTKREFQSYLREKSWQIAACDIIANAAKHGGIAYQRKDRPDVETVLIAHPTDDDRDPRPEAFVIAIMKGGWSLKIRVNGKSQHIRVMIEGASSFWHKFIQQWCHRDGDD